MPRDRDRVAFIDPESDRESKKDTRGEKRRNYRESKPILLGVRRPGPSPNPRQSALRLITMRRSQWRPVASTHHPGCSAAMMRRAAAALRRSPNKAKQVAPEPDIPAALASGI